MVEPETGHDSETELDATSDSTGTVCLLEAKLEETVTDDKGVEELLLIWVVTESIYWGVPEENVGMSSDEVSKLPENSLVIEGVCGPLLNNSRDSLRNNLGASGDSLAASVDKTTVAVDWRVSVSKTYVFSVGWFVICVTARPSKQMSRLERLLQNW